MLSFEKTKKAFKRKHEKGQTTFADEIEFRKNEKRNESRIRKAKDNATMEMQDEAGEALEDNTEDEEESLFVHDDTDDARPAKRTKGASPPYTAFSHPANPRSEDYDDISDILSDRGVADRFSGFNKPKSSGPTNAKTKAKNSKDKTATGGQGANKGRKIVQPKPLTKKAQAAARARGNVLNTANLLHTNIFRDAQTNTGFDELPTFTATRKAEAMKELISSLPQEHRKLAKMDRKQILESLSSFTGQGSCTSDGAGQWKMTGLVSVLSHYQMLGVSVMRKQETQQLEEPRGGILADQMGLGKTVMMIANIINGRKLPAVGPTLIVAPPSLLIQWMNELAVHADKKALGGIIRHHAGSRIGTPDPVASLCGYKVILTTYHEVSKSYPKWDPPADLITSEQKDAWWTEHYKEHAGTLHRITYHRVILDEAQAIKNHMSQTSIACRGLEATHRWAISGTPVQNSLGEFYPFFKFLRVPFTGSFAVFRRNFCSSGDPQGLERLGLFLSKFMIRRTHNDTLLGAKLLVLPPPSKRDLPCTFSDIEREIYMVVRTRFIIRINGFSRTGQLKRKYSHILTMLLRLRQLVGHPLLIQDTLRDLLEPEDFDKLKKITDKPVPPQSTNAAILRHLRMMLRAPKSLIELDSPVGLSTSGADGPASFRPENIDLTTEDTEPGPSQKTGKAFGLKSSYSDFFSDLLDTSGFTEEDTPRICVNCLKRCQNSMLTSCQHVYCHPCLLKLAQKASQKNLDHVTCVACGQQYTTAQTYTVQNGSEASKLEGERPEKKPKLTPVQVVNTWVDADGHMLPSTKTLAVKAQLLNWFQETPGCKVMYVLIHLPSPPLPATLTPRTPFKNLLPVPNHDPHPLQNVRH